MAQWSSTTNIIRKTVKYKDENLTRLSVMNLHPWGRKLLWNVGNKLPVNTAPYPMSVDFIHNSVKTSNHNLVKTVIKENVIILCETNK
jgi:hypothetical protein